MRNGKPVTHTSIGTRFQLVSIAFPVFGFLFFIGSALPWASSAQGGTAVVTGTQRVFVRRGPGLQYQPFGTLPRGTSVDIQEMQGEWARVLTANGQVGYVNSTFLALPAEAAKGTGTPETAPPTAPPARAESATLRPLQERNPALEAEARGLRQELEALKNRVEPTLAPLPTAGSTGAEVEQLRAQIARLTTAVEGLQRGLADTRSASEPQVAVSTSPSNDGAPHTVSPTALLLGAAGLGAGWLMGGAFGRRQERGRRSRIRF